MLYGDVPQAMSHVEFISYTGKYPNLCSGTLTLKIDGVEYKFHAWEYDNKTVFPKFWSSGGGIRENYEGTYEGEWQINVNDIPEQFRKYAREIDAAFNENVPYGCCGGCI